MVNKSWDDLNQVLHLMKVRKISEGFDLIPIRKKTENEVAQILRDSLIFLSFGKEEGFSLPPFEAMLCGCVVIGYHGGGGREYFKPEFSYPVESGDIIGFVRKIEEAVSFHRLAPAGISDMGRKASEYISSHYNARIETEDVVKTWVSILG